MAEQPYPTKTRLALLEAVRARDVIESPFDACTYLDQLGEPRQRVCARIKEAEAAGWVRLSLDVCPFWELTDAGRKVLDEAVRRG